MTAQKQADSGTRKQTATEFVTETIVGELKNGVEPWRDPTFQPGARNLLRSDTPYSIQNAALLAAYRKTDMFYVTERDVSELKAELSPMASPAFITFWKKQTKPATEEDRKKFRNTWKGKDGKLYSTLFVLRHYSVYGVSEVNDVSGKVNEKVKAFAKDTLTRHGDIDDFCEQLKTRGLVIEEGVKEGVNPLTGAVVMPPRSSFRSTEAYYETLLHNVFNWVRSIENTPATRKEKYEKYDVLVNELAALSLMAMYGVPRERNSSSYVQKWLTAIHENANALTWIMAWADKAVTVAGEIADGKR